MVTIAAGMVLLAAMPDDAPVWQVAAYLGLVGLGMASFSAPNASAIMGSVRRDQLSVASAMMGDDAHGRPVAERRPARRHRRQPARRTRQPAALHARRRGGASVIAVPAVDGYAQGYRYAMLAGAALALVGALVSLTRGGDSGEPADSRGPAPVNWAAGPDGAPPPSRLSGRPLLRRDR